YRKVFLARADQLAELVRDLGPFDILRAFWQLDAPHGVYPIFRTQTESTYVDLSKGEQAIYAGMHTNCRYKVRRAEKMRDRIEVVMNTDAARSDFLSFYNAFARNKGKMQLLKAHRFDEYLPHCDVFMLYFDGQPTCGRLVLRDEESGIALMLYSGTRRFDEGADTITVGLLNRYLHWHEMKTYQAAGMEKYDFGGTGGIYRSVTNFKLSFGGRSITSNYLLCAGAAPGVWKLAHSLYARWSGEAGIQRANGNADDLTNGDHKLRLNRGSLAEEQHAED
ncbi:MAG TPA: GNAT family N-acetyltransferase, partial [Candidatus Binataceae bacterium]|nr:GNAT family N-acetyltransferase [Candidatus Binataceae bacterium]